MSAESPVPNNPSDSLPVNPDSEPNQPSQTDAPFPVVGIAASAGGLEAFTELIRHLPTDTGMAFVLIQHLSPDHESLLSEILGRVTTMPVRQVQDQMRVEPNAVYVIPPNAQMTLVDGLLRLAPRQKSDGKYLPADIFFESLATERGNKAITVVLSGMDGDGAQGVKAVKIAGGVTFAECDATAQFNSMPNTAIATGNVDFVLPPQAIATELSNLSRHPFLGQSEPLQIIQELPPEPGDPLSRIFSLLRTTTGVDFTQYKPASLERRMQRRMILYKLDSLAAYAQYLQTHGDEIQALYEEILIHVTSFFRDPHVFEKLKTQIFPMISQKKASDAPLRIWVAGCSTGEEVYSLAICLLEFFSDRATVPSIQIFATDISETAISKARSGFYLESQMEGVSPERKSRFFVTQAEGGYQISSTIRELCVFAHHNLGGDPPFSNLDLISCRNLLIYLSDHLQERIMALFHYSLNLTGCLVLGTAESVKAGSNLFAPVDEACKIYARKLSLSNPLFAFTATSGLVPSLHNPQRIPENRSIPFDLAREVDQLIANRYMPLSVVVDEQMQILQMRGDLDLYLKLTPSTTELNLLSMAREGLVTPLRTALYQAQTENVLVRQEDIQMELGERFSAGDVSRTRLNLEVLPFRPALTNALYFLVLFNPISPSAPASATFTSPATVENSEPVNLAREIVTLRQALSAATQRELSAQAHLQAVIREQNQLNQNLHVANEEILSSNEELQSTNEELQTAKEEIQATNEELSTTNEELQSRNLQQNQDNSDLNNFIASINIPIVMLTNDLRIRRFTPTAQRLFNFIPTDIGRPFTDLHGNFDVSQLEPMILEVLETLNTKKQEIQTEAGYWYSIRIRPYRTAKNQIDGVTLVLQDIDTLKRHAASLESARNYAETIVETVQIPLVVLDADLRVNTANRSFYETFQVSEAETIHTLLFELGSGQWNIPRLRSMLNGILADELSVQDFEVNHDFEQIGQKNMLLNACKLYREDKTDMILLVLSDVTERKLAEQKIREQAALLDVATNAIFVQDLEQHILFWNKGAEHLYGWSAAEILGRSTVGLLHRHSATSLQFEAIQAILAQEGKWHGELQQVTKDGKDIIVESHWTLVRDEADHPKSILTVSTDITEKKQLQAQFLRAQHLESIGTLASGIAHDFNNILTPILAVAQLLLIKLTNLDEKNQHFLEILESSAKQGANLVKQILSFTSGQMEGTRTIVQVRHFLADIAQIARRTFPKFIETKTNLAPDLWTVGADGTQLHQIFMNLIVNARDAMPDGGILSISAENLWVDESYAGMHLDAEVGPYIVITIGDTGTGIAPEIIDRIFDPFFTTKGLGKGTGIGLSTVMGIIKSHSGFVNIYSEVGKGSTFKVYLPSSEVTEPQAPVDAEVANGNGELILVVDDEITICEITKTTLETHNYRVLSTSDGIGALALYSQYKDDISVVLIDLMMPGMDSFTTILTLQRINPQVKIITMSGMMPNWTNLDNRNPSIQVQEFLPKPFTNQALLNALQKMLHPAL